MTAPSITIADPYDDRLADYRELTDVALRTRWEQPNGLFIAEGELVVRRALRAGYRPRSLLVDGKRLDQLADLAAAVGGAPTSGPGASDVTAVGGAPTSGPGASDVTAVGGAPVYSATQDVLRQTTGFHVHRGVLASFHRRGLPTVQDVLGSAGRVAVLEDVNSHTNLGAVFRSAAALGMDGVLLSPSCADPLYRRSVRVSMGQVFAVPYARLAPWPDGLAAVREAGFAVLALKPDDDDALPIQRLSAADRERAALLLGAEGPGLSPGALAASDRRVAIPMRRGVDSLNVAAAAAVAFWELTR